MKKMKILYVTDLHGNTWKYEKILEIAKELRVNVVINGGDMLPKGDLFKQDKFISQYLDDYFSRFNSAKIYYLCYLGNDDLKIFDELFDNVCNKYSFVFHLAQRKFKLGGYEFIGMNWIVDYPFRLKDRCRMDTNNYTFQEQFGTGLLSTYNGWNEIDNWFSYAKSLPTIEEELNQLVFPKDMKKSIYIIHMPPKHLGLDECYNGLEAGSDAVYNFLKKHQPKLSLHGHIHESPEVTKKWYAKLGSTICIQPGQLDDLSYVIIDLSTDMKFDRIIN